MLVVKINEQKKQANKQTKNKRRKNQNRLNISHCTDNNNTGVEVEENNRNEQ